MMDEDMLSKLHRMRDISIELCQIDLDDEASFQVIIKLQEEQVSLREMLNGLISNYRNVDQIQQLFIECYEYEKELQQKILQKRLFAEEQIDKIRAGALSKNVYSGYFRQPEGYFFDSRN
ncbi:hypothetical protein J53TS2_10150 [Paenibacillus sp. J53TS2]|uniref:hypothetical protein n=1 Tax=Paenibacillus sp. J53TS2 TaxID=2807197 RepID=UPI001B2078F2|nr:hypothetical protein [Paenibacillus sp. J53TS2]GIP47424.1 hypothetical protein J53TS2_10150 [Paenibacillus sp. J53TS2]